MDKKIKEELAKLTVDEILRLAKNKGLTVHQVSNPDAITFGQWRIGGSKMTDGSDRWMNAANIVLYDKQSGK